MDSTLEKSNPSIPERKADNQLFQDDSSLKHCERSEYTFGERIQRKHVYNPYFIVVEFDHFKTQTGLPSFEISKTELNSISIIRKMQSFMCNSMNLKILK